jgi:hypothetical protein
MVWSQDDGTAQLTHSLRSATHPNKTFSNVVLQQVRFIVRGTATGNKSQFSNRAALAGCETVKARRSVGRSGSFLEGPARLAP